MNINKKDKLLYIIIGIMIGIFLWGIVIMANFIFSIETIIGTYQEMNIHTSNELINVTETLHITEIDLESCKIKLEAKDMYNSLMRENVILEFTLEDIKKDYYIK